MDEDDTVSAQALRESEELHRITLLNMSDAVFITDDEGLFTFICPNVDVIFGWGPEEVRAMGRISRLLGRELVDRALLGAKGEIQNIEHEAATKGGSPRALLVHIKRVAIRGGTTLYVCRDITERKQSEQKLRRNEERLTMALEAASMGTWDWHVPSGEMTWSPQTHRILGDAAGGKTPSFDTFLKLLHPSDRDRVARAMNEAMERGSSYETEFRVMGCDHVERWVVGKGKALRNGKPLRMLGVFVDFTDRHRLADELRELGGQLIHAHEQERIRVARELHDDLAQRVASLSIGLGALLRQAQKDPGAMRQRIAELSATVTALGSDLHRVSCELHPAALEQLGLAAALRGCCAELSKTHGLEIRVEIAGVPQGLPADVALCLYRIAQEALHNVVRHSGAGSVTVSLMGSAGEVTLNVSDDGVGFDPGGPRKDVSLGLIGMRERIRLVNGRLVVESAVGRGTRIEARVPLRGAAI
jgi:PAS domain S-box-containing protein